MAGSRAEECAAHDHWRRQTDREAGQLTLRKKRGGRHKHAAVLPGSKRLGQEEHEFGASLGCTGVGGGVGQRSLPS